MIGFLTVPFGPGIFSSLVKLLIKCRKIFTYLFINNIVNLYVKKDLKLQPGRIVSSVFLLLIPCFTFNRCILDLNTPELLRPDYDVSNDENQITDDFNGSIDDLPEEPDNSPCGNMICEGNLGENCITCPVDCSMCSCTSDTDCPYDYVCDMDGRCRRHCTTENDCPNLWFCMGGICMGDVDVLCSNYMDDDGDGLIDCDDPDCLLNGCVTVCDAERGTQKCSDGIDNDMNGKVDCNDENCIFDKSNNNCNCSMINSMECGSKCNDSIDNDSDTLIDCSDPDCKRDPHISMCNSENTDESCSDAEDNDGNNFMDCDDPMCRRTPSVTKCCLSING